MADATKNCESFSFRLLSLVQKLHSYKCTLIKAPTFQHTNKYNSLIVQTVNSSNTLKCLPPNVKIILQPFVSVVSGSLLN